MSHVGPREPATVVVTGRRSIADVIWVANTRHGPGGHWFARPHERDPDHDHLRAAADAVRYLVDHKVTVPAEPPTTADLAALGRIREIVRGIAEAGDSPATDGVLETGLQLTADGRLGAASDGWPGFIADLAVPILALLREPRRLSTCANPRCRLVFLDGSKSGTRRWCDNAGCGNRSRVHRYRQREERRPSKRDLAARGSSSRGTIRA
jgi:predicted RNA-binding Zn ribbon-like protein